MRAVEVAAILPFRHLGEQRTLMPSLQGHRVFALELFGIPPPRQPIQRLLDFLQHGPFVQSHDGFPSLSSLQFLLEVEPVGMRVHLEVGIPVMPRFCPFIIIFGCVPSMLNQVALECCLWSLGMLPRILNLL